MQEVEVEQRWRGAEGKRGPERGEPESESAGGGGQGSGGLRMSRG